MNGSIDNRQTRRRCVALDARSRNKGGFGRTAIALSIDRENRARNRGRRDGTVDRQTPREDALPRCGPLSFPNVAVNTSGNRFVKGLRDFDLNLGEGVQFVHGEAELAVVGFDVRITCLGSLKRLTKAIL